MAVAAPGNHWTSRFAFLMAAIGSAVGLGNIWRFPYLAGENGGAAFLLIYVVTTTAIALPILMAEIMIGRMGGRSPMNTMIELVRRYKRSYFWILIGLGSTIGAFVVLSYYSVIGGWALKYIQAAMTGEFAGATAESSGALFGDFTGDANAVILWHSIFLGLTALIVVGGLNNGIERAVTILMPLLFILLIGMAIYAVSTPGFSQGWHFLFDVDLEEVTRETFLAAIGQGFFSVSVALGAMMAYGAYLDADVSIPRSAIIIAAADTSVAIIAGIAIFPLVFTYGLEASSGPGLIFVTLPVAFGQMPNGEWIGAAFFILLSVAAITSAISLLEPVVHWAEESFGVRRGPATLVTALAAWLVGLLSAFSFNAWAAIRPLPWFERTAEFTFFDTFDFSSSNIVMPTVGLLIALFAGWALPWQTVADHMNAGDAVWFRIWRILLRFVAPIGVLSIFVVNVLL